MTNPLTPPHRRTRRRRAALLYLTLTVAATLATQAAFSFTLNWFTATGVGFLAATMVLLVVRAQTRLNDVSGWTRSSNIYNERARRARR